MSRETVLQRFGKSPRHEGPTVDAVIDGRYRLDSPVGHGAFGKVYRATDLASQQTVAVKVFDARLDETGYLQELGLMFSEVHPQIVQTYAFGYTSGRKYIVYEYLRGGSLRDLLVRQPRSAPAVALRILRQVACGLAFAHSRRIVHRDLKPENLLLTGLDWPFDVKLCDFGLSARFRPGDRFHAQFGSPAYMAPEHFGGTYDHRVDLYAAGVILYEMLFGRRPHGGDATSLRHAHQNVPPALPVDGPPRMLELLRGLLQKDPEQRLRSADELVARVDAAIAEIERAPAPVALPDPTFEDWLVESRWTLRLAHPCSAFASTREGALLLGLPDRISVIEANGRIRTAVRGPEAAVSIAEGSMPGAALVWTSAGTVYLERRGIVLDLSKVVTAPTGPHRMVVSPDGRHLAVATPAWVDLVDLDMMQVVWRAEVATYGAPPEVSFCPSGQLIWLSSEAPRTQLTCLNLRGDATVRTAAGSSDAQLVARQDGGVLVAARGRREVQVLSPDGLVATSHELASSLVELQRLGPSHLVALSGRYLEVLDVESLRSRALLPRPDSDAVPVVGLGGLFLIETASGSVSVRRYAIGPLAGAGSPGAES